MNEQDEERRIRGLLEKAHRADQAPPFRRTWDAASRIDRHRQPLWPYIQAAAAVALLIFSNIRPKVSPEPPPQSLPALQWNAPLDFLLQTPGSELLKTVPNFDADRSLE